ncbi:oxacillin-hydrolyzing class D beta-lactamase OXA-50 [Luteitalea sp. TBR-22]|uniref:penicillin-binding transpeptidase domain-containing protein n=1 Tax=Luteitalea sp. TBR-22 TaxID=2802971 RepID=UPI001AF09070|nr:penicillin-binding transpeptidase domain-containing protein [Luteitalea sp. TBR-22]BCS30933.1 oxacillin-hydrolyzing class D beta-lactamase OXA-50 [Luteitalea sp. TBR-22]
MRAAVLLVTLALLAGGRPATTVPDLSSFFDGLDATFVLLDGATGAYTRHAPARAARRFAPCSTFKVPHTAMLLESGIVPATTGHALEYDPSLKQPEQWARDFDLAGAFKASALWYYRAQARRLGMDAEAQYVRRLGYGNMVTTGGLDGPNGPFWVDGSLRISADEQVAFLHRLHEGRLGLSPRTTALTREVMLVEEPPRWKLFAKTGACRPQGEQTSNWYVGFVEKRTTTWYFALQMGADDYGRAFTERVPTTRRVLTALGVLD